MEDFFNSYKLKYFVLPLYYLVDIFKQINKEYDDYIDKLYNDNVNTHEGADFFPDFIIPTQFDNLNSIKSNSKIFVHEYIVTKPTQINTNTQTNPNMNIDMDINKYIVSLRNDSIYLWFVNKFLYRNFISNNFNELWEKKIFDNKINNYTIYKLNTKTNLIQVHLIQSNLYKIIKQNIFKNYILISNILALDSKYNEITDLNYNYDYDELFTKWIEPIEPIEPVEPIESNTDYKKLLSMKISEETIVIGEQVYTDILCFRNFIQIDYLSGLRFLYQNNPDENLIMPILYTKYRTNKLGQVLTILH